LRCVEGIERLVYSLINYEATKQRPQRAVVRLCE
jgi:hypothetical protein